MAPKDPPPLEPFETSGGYHHNVIDLAGVRIQLGRAKIVPGQIECKHNALIYSTHDRRIWCEDCERTIDSFDAFMLLVDNFERMTSAARSALSKAEYAKNATLVRRAAKELDRTWSGSMVPCCPHCSRGLMAHDFDGGAASCISKELEQARRQRDIDNRKNPNPEKPL